MAACLLAAALAAACGGGGEGSVVERVAVGSGGEAGAEDERETGTTADAREAATLAAEPSSTYARHCANPRYGAPYFDSFGSLTQVKYWVGTWSRETYLWYQELPKLSPADYRTPVDYFDALKTRRTAADGRPKDRFHFSSPTGVAEDLMQDGESLGYGMQIALLRRSPPRRAVVVYTEPGTPASAQSVRRGAEILRVDGADLVEGDDVDTLNAGLFPEKAGSRHTFVIRDFGASRSRSVTLKVAKITSKPVQSVKIFKASGRKLGYLLFNDHVATAEKQLVSAVRSLDKQGPIDDLVLDIRYNGGGYLDIASELAYMIAGKARTRGKTFERQIFNDRNPFGFSSSRATKPFHDTTQGFSGASGAALPSLNLARVFVLTGSGTCSASEAIINGLRGIGVEVIQIGTTTCGKPYGFYPAENCGTTYFTVQFRGVNAKGFGDYAEGFVPAGTRSNGVKGCKIADDFKHALGDRAEKRIAAALNYSVYGTCSRRSAPLQDEGGDNAAAEREPQLMRSPLRENRFYRAP